MKYKIEWDEKSPCATVLRERKGRIYGIRYAKGGRNKAEILGDMILNPPLRSEWRPYNTMTGTFTDVEN